MHETTAHSIVRMAILIEGQPRSVLHDSVRSLIAKFRTDLLIESSHAFERSGGRVSSSGVVPSGEPGEMLLSVMAWARGQYSGTSFTYDEAAWNEAVEIGLLGKGLEVKARVCGPSGSVIGAGRGRLELSLGRVPRRGYQISIEADDAMLALAEGADKLQALLADAIRRGPRAVGDTWIGGFDVQRRGWLSQAPGNWLNEAECASSGLFSEVQRIETGAGSSSVWLLRATRDPSELTAEHAERIRDFLSESRSRRSADAAPK